MANPRQQLDTQVRDAPAAGAAIFPCCEPLWFSLRQVEAELQDVRGMDRMSGRPRPVPLACRHPEAEPPADRLAVLSFDSVCRNGFDRRAPGWRRPRNPPPL